MISGAADLDAPLGCHCTVHARSSWPGKGRVGSEDQTKRHGAAFSSAMRSHHLKPPLTENIPASLATSCSAMVYIQTSACTLTDDTL